MRQEGFEEVFVAEGRLLMGVFMIVLGDGAGLHIHFVLSAFPIPYISHVWSAFGLTDPFPSRSTLAKQCT